MMLFPAKSTRNHLNIVVIIIIIFVIVIIIIIIPRPRLAFGRLGLGGSSGGKTLGGVSLRAFGAQLGSEAIYIGTSQSIIIILTILIIIMIC